MLVNKENFGDFYKEHSKKVLFVAFRLFGNWQESEDLTQEVFLNVMKLIVDRPLDIHNPLAYLNISVINLFHENYRKRAGKSEIHIEDELLIKLFKDVIDPKTLPEQVKQEELQVFVRELVEKLAEINKIIITLRYLSEFPLKHKEILNFLRNTYSKYKKLSYQSYQKLHENTKKELRKKIKYYLDGRSI